MRHQRQPSHWSCLPTAFANILDVNVRDIFNFLGHDGSEVLFEKLFIPCGISGKFTSLGDVVYHDAQSRRAFHIQEMFDYCYSLGVAVVPIDSKLVSSNGYETITIKPEKFDCSNISRLHYYLTREDGVLAGYVNNRSHATTWYKGKIYDPNGTVYDIDKFNTETFYVVKKII